MALLHFKFPCSRILSVLVAYFWALGVYASEGGVLINRKPLSGENEQTISIKAEAGDVNAQYELGWIAAQRDDFASAANWFQKAADQGDNSAKFNLGMLIAKGNSKLSFQYCMEAAEAGLPEAMIEIGERFISGTKGAKKDTTLGVEWISKASTAGSVLADLLLAPWFFSGEYTGLADYDKAFYHALRVENSGGPGADSIKRILAWLYLNGQGTPENLPEAMRILTELSAKGDALSQELLGMLLISQSKDTEGLVYLVASVRNGNISIQNQVDRHLKQYSKEQQDLISNKANEISVKK